MHPGGKASPPWAPCAPRGNLASQIHLPIGRWEESHGDAGRTQNITQDQDQAGDTGDYDATATTCGIVFLVLL